MKSKLVAGTETPEERPHRFLGEQLPAGQLGVPVTEEEREAPEPEAGAPARAEAGIVPRAGFGVPGRSLFERFLQERGVVTLPFEHHHAGVAVEAFPRSGRGRHAAKLSLGDRACCATAENAREPLPCTGNGFPQTDLELVELES